MLPLSGLNADRLAEALRRVTGDPRYTLRAAELAARVGLEDGAGAVARGIAEAGAGARLGVRP
ncbi:hypothetical protein GCM10020000_08250 [Streptomyces olivoverticillatus]